MNPLAGKTTSERNKMIAAVVLGVVALSSLYLAFGRGIFSGSTTVAVEAKPTPKVGSPSSDTKSVNMPSHDELNFGWTTTAIDYKPGNYDAPPPGRNIFAFAEPPECYPNCPKPPTPTPAVKTPTPTPTPPMHLEFVTPQTIYAGSSSFRLEANGDRFDPTARLYFNMAELPTQFVSPQKLTANVPSSMIANAGSVTVIAQTPDGRLYSEQAIINVQPPPKPSFKYVGMIARARYNNDTAYFMETGKQLPTAARLNDVVGGRFRLVSISSAETVFEDVSLGFKHRLKLDIPPPGSTPSTGPGRPTGFPTDGGVYIPYNPNNPTVQPQDIPGIPSNVPRAQPPQNLQRPTPKKDKDEDDDGDGGG
jgi:hypothetical protein